MPTPEEITRHEDDVPTGAPSAWVGDARPETGVEVVEPDPAWPAAYAEVAALVRDALGDRVLVLQHVGSTAVPGLVAKPVLDVDLVVGDVDDEAAWLPPLEAAGFVLRVREPWWQGHRGLRLTSPVVSNLHVFGPGAAEPVRHRIFRDWLTEHPEDRERYAEAKRVAARQTEAAGEHVMDYNARKQAVVREIYDRAFVALGLLPGPGTAPTTPLRE
ncbi:GrpB family protein [Nocardioides aurantiacus]|uniref:GrpB-like predicted nucleotidyltransferase (UPF0157 family) n=1 Tax=Nocardioides aurantiacus TaxID=86796 RepID=A0A3N2CQJ9_9ACTN|nr:GrpB family protein [Nocardioides aurantiacus]ROR89594.1 GrpB-like predicted nucleotidyltransferase (UPF0157 family) [Nocardioides aurantiacus]